MSETPPEPMSRLDAARPTERTRVRRKPDRGRYDLGEIAAILDAAFVCHLGFDGPEGPVVLPTAYARSGSNLFLHGAAGSASLKLASTGVPVCAAVTIVDGLVLARSAFNHSINYRSVVVFGHAREVTDPGEKCRAFDVIVEHLVPGRAADARGPSDSELRATRVVCLPIEEAAAKVRSGGPHDDGDDLGLAVWAGQIPLRLVAGTPIAEPGPGGVPPMPAYVANFGR